MMAHQFNNTNDVLLLETRRDIFSTINQFPAIHFRELQRRQELGTGNLEYHIKYLEKANLIKIERSNGNTRFYPLGLSDYERKILGVLRQNNFRKIILKLLTEKSTNHKNISNYLGVSSSSTTWYLNRLIECKILSAVHTGREKIYEIRNQHEILKILISHHMSFLDKLVDKFVAAWEK